MDLDYAINIRGLVAGDDWTLPCALSFRDASGNLVPSPAWINGDVLKMDVRRNPSDAQRVLRLSSAPQAGEGTITLTAEGITLSVTSAISGTLPLGDFVHDIELTRSGLKSTIASGALSISQKITRG